MCGFPDSSVYTYNCGKFELSENSENLAKRVKFAEYSELCGISDSSVYTYNCNYSKYSEYSENSGNRVKFVKKITLSEYSENSAGEFCELCGNSDRAVYMYNCENFELSEYSENSGICVKLKDYSENLQYSEN